MFLKFTPAFCVVLCFVHCVRQRMDLLAGEGTRGDGKRKVTLGFCSLSLLLRRQVWGEGTRWFPPPPAPPPLCETLLLAQIQNQKMVLGHYHQTMRMTGKPT